MSDKKTPKPIKPYSRYWQSLANTLARNSVTIHACQKCGYPVVDGYCCRTCGTDEP